MRAAGLLYHGPEDSIDAPGALGEIAEFKMPPMHWRASRRWHAPTVPPTRAPIALPTENNGTVAATMVYRRLSNGLMPMNHHLTTEYSL